jgi:hypothetical protein
MDEAATNEMPLTIVGSPKNEICRSLRRGQLQKIQRPQESVSSTVTLC